MNKHKIILGMVAVVLSTAFLNSCKKERIEVNTNGGDLYQSYLPLSIGKYIIYDVDSSIWDDTKCIKYTEKYQHQYLVADTFRDGQKRLSYVIYIKTRRKSTDIFTVDDVIYYTPGAEQMERVQKNIRVMTMVNPIVENKVWAGNNLVPGEDQDYSFLKGWKFTYLDVLKPFNNGAINFENTVTVSETDQVLNNPETQPDNNAYLLQSKAVYAFRVGMIYREYTYWTYDPIPGEKNCRKGVGVVMRAVEYN